jgi:hypothetical protein
VSRQMHRSALLIAIPFALAALAAAQKTADLEYRYPSQAGT